MRTASGLAFALAVLVSIALSGPAHAATKAPAAKAATAPPTAPAVLPVVPAATPAPLPPDELAARLAALEAGLHSLQSAAGIPTMQVPPQVWDTKAGQAVAITLSVVVSLVGAGATAYGAYELAHK